MISLGETISDNARHLNVCRRTIQWLQQRFNITWSVQGVPRSGWPGGEDITRIPLSSFINTFRIRFWPAHKHGNSMNYSFIWQYNHVCGNKGFKPIDLWRGIFWWWFMYGITKSGPNSNSHGVRDHGTQFFSLMNLAFWLIELTQRRCVDSMEKGFLQLTSAKLTALEVEAFWYTVNHRV